MKHLLLSCLLLGSLATPLSAAQVESVEIFSPSMNRPIKTAVVLPEKYKDGQPLPVVYLLHGYSGNYQSWVKDFPALTNLVDQYEFIVVSPDGGFSSWYFDSWIDAKFRYETFVARELVESIDAKYRTVRDRKGRAISGLSMGGHGALFLAFKHQDVFGAAGSMSGGVDLRPFPMNWDISKRIGDYATHPQAWETNSVINLVHLLKPHSLSLMIDCGTSDFFYDVNKALHEKLLYRNIPHDYIEREGEHNLKYWQNSLPYHCLFFHRYFKKAE